MRYTIVFLLFLSPILGFAQTLNLTWQAPRSYDELPNLVVQSLFQASDGRIVGVGQMGKNAENTEGVVFFIDAVTGNLSGKPTYLKYLEFGYNSIVGAVESLNGGFILIGNTGKNANETKAWLLQVDEKGNRWQQSADEIVEGVVFEKILSSPIGEIQILGKKKSGGLTLMNWQNGLQPTNLMPIDLAEMAGVLAVQYDADNHIRLAGSDARTQEAWATNAEGRIQKWAIADNVDIKTASFDPNCQSIFWGNWLETPSKICFSIPNPTAKTLATKALILPNDERKAAEVLAILTAFAPPQYLIVSSYRDVSGVRKNGLQLFDAEQPTLLQKINQDLGEAKEFEVKGCVEGFDNTVFVWGQVQKKRTEPTVLRLYAFKWVDLKSKNAANFKSKSEPITHSDLKLEDPKPTGNGNQILEPNESGSLTFLVKSSLPIKHIGVECLLLTNKSGVLFPKGQNLTFNLVNGQAKIVVPITANNSLTSGQVGFKMVLKNGTQVLKELTAEIAVNNPLSTKGGFSVDYNDSDLKSGKKTSSHEVPFRPTVSVPPSVTPKFKVANNSPKHSRWETKEIKSSDDGSSKIVKTEIMLHVEDGENRIPIEIDYGSGIFRDTLIITFVAVEKQKPTLHILAIAPFDTSLVFNRKDIADMVSVAQNQRGGIYAAVKTTVLTSADSTKADFIRTVVANFVIDNAIGKQDVVWVILSSHGKIIGENFKIIPSNYDDRTDRLRELSTVDYKTDILNELQKLVSEAESKRKVLVFIDACHSGAGKSKAVIEFEDPKLSAKIKAINAAAGGIFTFSSTTDSLLSYEDSLWQNGAFIEAVLEAFENKTVLMTENKITKTLFADRNADGYLTLLELYDYVRQRVPDLLRQHPALKYRHQIPMVPTHQLADDTPFFKLKNGGN